MNLIGKSVMMMVASAVLALAMVGTAEAGQDRWSISYYGGGGYHGPGYGVTYSTGGRIHPDYLYPGPRGYRAYGTYPHPRNYYPRAPWCSTHRLNHHHGHHHDHHDHYGYRDYGHHHDGYGRGYNRGYHHDRRDGRYRNRDRYYR